MEISFIHMQILVHLHVNQTNFHMKGCTLRLALKQVKGNWEITHYLFIITMCLQFIFAACVGNLTSESDPHSYKAKKAVAKKAQKKF